MCVDCGSSGCGILSVMVKCGTRHVEFGSDGINGRLGVECGRGGLDYDRIGVDFDAVFSECVEWGSSGGGGGGGDGNWSVRVDCGSRGVWGGISVVVKCGTGVGGDGCSCGGS